MGGILGGSKSQGSSQSSSEQRQALFFPTDIGLRQSLGALQSQFALAAGKTQPFTGTSTDALNEMRLLTGMEPIDPLQDETAQLEALYQRQLGATITDRYGNPYHVAFPYQQAMTELQGVIESNDPEERERRYQAALNRLDSAQAFVDQAVQRAQTEKEGTKIDYESLRLMQNAEEDRNALRAAIIRDYVPGAGPVPLSQEEIEAKLQQDPGYQFRFNQGTRAVEQAAAARGGLYSGRTMKELAQFGQDLAAQQYQQTLGNYAAMAGMGSPFLQQLSSDTTSLGQLIMAGQQDLNREWNMSPWTARSQSSSQQSSSSSPGIGGLLSSISGFFK